MQDWFTVRSVIPDEGLGAGFEAGADIDAAVDWDGDADRAAAGSQELVADACECSKSPFDAFGGLRS